MNKTVSVNIGGIVFNIEEQAYEQLNRYLETIKTYFSEAEGREEIVNDIEVRIAELFQERIKPHKQVIVMVDVEEIIDIMGQPEAYIDEDAATGREHGERVDPESTGKKSRKMYRDTDDRIIGGVCSGIALYFGWEVLWVRLIFALSFIFFGTGILIYFLLWFILPEARTTAEKLEMRGEKVNVENIKQHFHKIKEDIKDLDTRESRDKFTGAARQFGEGIGRIIGVGFFFVAVILSSILLYWLFAQDFVINISNTGPQGFAMSDLLDITFSPFQEIFLHVGITLVFLGPIIGLVAAGFRLTMNIRPSTRIVGVISSTLWILGLLVLTVLGLSTWRSMESHYTYKDSVSIDQPKKDIMYIDVMEDELFSMEYRDTEDFFWELISVDGDDVHLGWPKLDVTKSANENYEVVVYKDARGATQHEAISRARGIHYPVVQEGDRLVVSPYFTFAREDKYRWQDVRVELRVPQGKSVHFSQNAGRVLTDIDNDGDYDEDQMTGKTWTMGRKYLTQNYLLPTVDTVYVDTSSTP